MIRLASSVLLPVLGLIWAAAFLVGLADAPRAARLVPNGVALALIVAALLQMLRELAGARGRPAASGPRAQPDRLFAVLALLGYYPSFLLVGFHITNLLFLLAILAILRPGLATALGVAFGTTAIVSGLALALGLNLPTPWLFQ